MKNTPPVCDYEGSEYQQVFWEQGGRAYEDLAESIALKRMLPAHGSLMLELGAGAGRNTPRYSGFERVVLVDYSTTQLAQARQRLGVTNRYIYVAADIYRLPFHDDLFDAATMIRVLHHMADAPKALAQVRRALRPGAIFILEFANKLNLKSIVRYWMGKQEWNPFTLEPVEFVKLNFDFHPGAVRAWLRALDFSVERILTVSHFRLGVLKRLLPAKFLAALDGFFQWTGALWQMTPSVFIKARAAGEMPRQDGPLSLLKILKCPDCGGGDLQEKHEHLLCPKCKARWAVTEGIYDFREKIK